MRAEPRARRACERGDRGRDRSRLTESGIVPAPLPKFGENRGFAQAAMVDQRPDQSAVALRCRHRGRASNATSARPASFSSEAI